MPRHFRSHREEDAVEHSRAVVRWLSLAACATIVAGVWAFAFLRLG